MPRYLPRWALAVFVVVPLMMIVVPAAQLASVGLKGPHADDPLWMHVLGMLGFYGAYALVAATFVSLVHTRLVRGRANAGAGRQMLWAAGLGILALVPQALVFGQEYWMVNVVAGAVAGGIYWALLAVLMKLGQKSG
jgi:hypothetical protein